MSSISKKLKNLKDYRSTVDPKVKDEIIIEYAPLVKFIAQKIAARLPANIELDDLISCGVIGLMDAIEKFDPTRDNKFKTYAEFRIRGAILDELRSIATWNIYISNYYIGIMRVNGHNTIFNIFKIKSVISF